MRSFPALLAAAALCLLSARNASAAPGRSAHTSTLLPTGDILIAGGIDSLGGYLSTTLIKQTSKDGTMIGGPPLAVARSSHTATLMGNGCVLIAGGVNGGGPRNDAQIYDPISNSYFSPTNNMTARYNHTATLLNDGRVLLCGGQTTGGAVIGTCDLFTPTGVMGGGNCGGSFSAGAVAMLHPRTLHTATLLQDGKVWFAGGWDGSAFTPTTEKYIPSPPSGAGSFSSASPMIQARALHTATMMGDGNIFVAGGFDGIDLLENKGILDTSEIYDPVANNTIPGPTLEARRLLHSSTLRPDGTVMLFGGLGNITTTYLGTPALAFGTPSIINAPAGAVTAGASPPSLANVAFTLGAGVAGTITDGQILFAQSSATFAWGYAVFQDPLVESLAGTTVTCDPVKGCGQVYIPSLSLANIGGTAHFNPITFSATAKASGGLLNTSGASISAGSDAQFTPTLGMPGLVNAVVTGTVSGVTGTLTSTSYTVVITNGSIAITAAPVDAAGNLTFSADVTSLAGTIVYNPFSASSAGTPIATAGNLSFSPSPLDSIVTANGALTSPSSATFPLTIDMPADLEGATVTGIINIQSGDISQLGGGAATNKYTASLTGGTVNFSGTVSGGKLTLPSVTASNLTGTINCSSGTISTGVTDSGALISIAGQVTSYSATGIVPTAAAMLDVTGGTMNYSATNITIDPKAFLFNAATVTVAGMVFGQAEYYDPKHNTVAFSAPGGNVGGTADPKIETIGPTATQLPDGDVFMFGGADCSGGAACPNVVSKDTATLFVSSPNNFSTTLGSLNTPRALHSATLLPDGTILVAGGTDGLNLLSSAEIFDPGTEKFTPTAGSMSAPRDLHTATLLTNGRVLIAGGDSTNSLSTGAISGADIYYPDTKLFIPTASMAAARSNHTATLMPDGTVIVVGGYGAGNVITGTAEKFDPEHMTWTSLAATSPRALHTATLLKDGRILVVGGLDTTGVLNTVVAYTPGTDSWATMAPMPVALRSQTATLLFDGRVLVSGGNDGNGETGSSYIYDPTLNSWTPNAPPSTTPIGEPRFGHTANLLPDGSVMITGGFTKSGAIPPQIERYHIDGSTWVGGNQFSIVPRTRANHTMTLAANGKIYAIGGTDGVIGGNGTTFWGQSEKAYFTDDPDAYSKSSPPSLRQSSFTITSATPLQPGGAFKLAGSKFLGGTEASGGGSASANSSFDSPHVVLQRTDAAGFSADLSQTVFSAATPPTNSSLAATLPATSALLPDGWYSARVGINGVYSNGTLVQVGPARPASAPASLTGTAQGISSITWNWSALAGVDGYNLYIASNGVFIATVAYSAGSSSFTETGLAANSINQIRVAGYTLTGDGPTALSPLTAVTPVTVITKVTCGAGGSGDTTTSIPWSWTPVPSAQSYNVYNSTTGALIAVTSSPNFYDTGLGTSTARTLTIGAVSAGIESALTAPSTCYTLAAPPLPPLISQNLPVMDASTDTVTLNWIANGNPAGTNFESVLTRYDVTPPSAVTISTTGVSTAFTGLLPSSYYSAQIFAVNGAGALAGPLAAGTTFTFPAQPSSISIVGTTPVSIAVAWDNTANSTMTYYQILASTDTGFTGIISTAVPFSSRYNGSTFTVAGLLTGQQYFISVTAENPFGQVTVPIQVGTVTYNGGAPTGSLSGLIPAIGGAEFSGTIGGLTLSRYVDMRSPGGSFPADTVVTISTYNLLTPGHVACANAVTGIGGAGIALNIENDPVLQPIRPLYLTGSYSSLEAGSFPGPLSQIALARYDPLSGTCIPLRTVFNSAARSFVAELNHFSLYQLVSVPLASTADTARIFPNPFHAATEGYVTIDHIPPAARVRVFTLRGERILDAVADGAGNVTWSGDNSAGRSVASGLYLIVIEAGGTKKIMKLAVIR